MQARDQASPLLEADGVTIIVHVFPDDDRLLRDVRKVGLAVAAEARGVEKYRAAVEHGLRSWYPRLVIARREALASIGSEEVWYVLRDGRVERPRPERDRLYGALATARETTAVSRVAIDHAASTIADAGRRHRAADDEPEASPVSGGRSRTATADVDEEDS